VYQSLCHEPHYTSFLAGSCVHSAGRNPSPYGPVFSLCARVSMIIMHNVFIGPVCVTHDESQAACLRLVGLSPPGSGWQSISQNSLEQNETKKVGSRTASRMCDGVDTRGKVHVFMPVG